MRYSRFRPRLIAALAAATFAGAIPALAQNQPSTHDRPAPPQRPSAQERGTVSAEFRTALEPYGSFRHHSRWGEVWVPNDRRRDWRPYTVGKWIYSDDYGWFWDAAQEEARWGAVVYHYGRWVFEADLGWVWVPGRVWGPSWVSWRHGRGGSRLVGWAPLPPEEIIVDIREEPRYWVFVEPRELVSADVLIRVVRPAEPVLLRETVIVSHTVVVQRERAIFAVNPGLSPSFVAVEVGRPIPAFEVRPHVLAGTFAPPNAVSVRAEDFRSANVGATASLQGEVRQARQIAPSPSAKPPEPLTDPRQLRLGEDAPRAARGAQTIGTSAPAGATPQAPTAQQQRQQQQPPRQETQQGQPPQQQGQQGQPPQRQGQQGQPQQPQPGQAQQAQPQRGQPQPGQRQGREQGERGAPPATSGTRPGQEDSRGVTRPESRGRPTEPRREPPAAREREGGSGPAAAPADRRSSRPEPANRAPAAAERSAPERSGAAPERSGGTTGAPSREGGASRGEAPRERAPREGGRQRQD